MQFSVPVHHIAGHVGNKESKSMRAAGVSFVRGARILILTNSRFATVTCDPEDLPNIIGPAHAAEQWLEAGLDMTPPSEEVVAEKQKQRDLLFLKG